MRTSLILVAILFVLGFLFGNFPADYSLFTIGRVLFLLGYILAFGMMLVKGTFIRTTFFKISAAAFAVELAAVLMFAITRTEFYALIIGPSLIIIVLYVIHFLRKSPAVLLDWLKLFVALSMALMIPIFQTKVLVPGKEYALSLISQLIFWITFYFFVKKGRREGWFVTSRSASENSPTSV